MRRLSFALTVVFALALGVTTAQANVYVNWLSSAGFYFESTAGGVLAPEESGNSTIVQLIWSSDNVADSTADVNDANYMSGEGDVFLTQTPVSENGVTDAAVYDEWAVFAGGIYDDGGAQSSGGYIYGRIFEDDTPASGELFYVGEIEAADDLNPDGTPGDSPQTYDMNRDATNGDQFSNTTGTSDPNMGEVVPEPATLSLFALGVGIIGLRRKQKS